MHRYPTVGGGSGVGNSTSGGISRETVRSDLGFSTPSSFPLTSRRLVPLIPYTLKCDQEPLSARLGPPDYFPPTPNCAEESLSRDACQNGYKETVDGIEESREVAYSLVNEQVWAKPLINKYKEAIRKRLKALNNSLLQKHKAGQVYGVPLSGPLLAKSGHFPEQRHSGEDKRKKWIEDLAQHKRLRILADHVPHGLRRKSLFEVLIKNEVPFLRATWCIKVMYLNQVRPLAIGVSAGSGDKSQQKRVELWTKDVLEYMQALLDELCQHGDTGFSALGRNSCALLSLASASQQPSDFVQGNLDAEVPSLQKKWHYMFRLMQLHFSEGLLHRTQVIDWLLKQLQEREPLDAVELLLPIVLDLIDEISTCQTLVRTVVDVFLYKLGELCPAGNLPNASEQPRQYYVATFFAELLSYLLTVVPDSFVALDCFPLPPYIYGSRNNAGHGSDHLNEAETFTDGKGVGVAGPSGEKAFSKLRKSQRPHTSCEVGLKSLADAVQKRTASLAKAVNLASLRKNEGSVIQSLDKALITGDILAAYHCMFDDDLCGHEQPPDEWITKVSPLLSGSASPSELFAVCFLCEWAICDFRDCRKMVKSLDHKTANARAVCRVYMAVSVLCLRLEEMEKQKGGTSSAIIGAATSMAGIGCQMIENSVQGYGGKKGKAKGNLCSKAVSLSAFFDSPGPIHDIIAAWLDQHELRKGEGFEILQLLLWELVKKGLFWPPAYVRKLIVSGVLEKKQTPSDWGRALRHRRLLQHLPWPPGLSMEEDGRRSSDPVLVEAIRIHQNERRFSLNALDQHHSRLFKKEIEGHHQQLAQEAPKTIEASSGISETKFSVESMNSFGNVRRSQRKKMRVMDLKQAVAKCLHFPDWCVADQAVPMADKFTLWQAYSKRQLIPQGNFIDKLEATPGCEECGRNKRQKTNDGNSVFIQGLGMSPGDEDDMWWVKKVAKTTDVVKTDPIATLKPPKQPSRGRPKAVRKLSLAQLAAARIEGSQGASSSHTCDSKVNCPYHKPAVEDNVLCQNKESKKVPLMQDLKAIGTALKRLRLTDKHAIATWIGETVRNLVEGGDKAASISTSLQHSVRSTVCAGGSAPADDRIFTRWQFGEEELSTILWLFDIANDFCSLIRLLLWLLPKASLPTASSPGQSNRFSTASWNKESVCEITESMILTCLRGYEGVLLATNLLPEALSAGMQRVALLMTPGSGGRIACVSLFSYIHDLYKKYSSLASLQLWEKNWKACSDQRLVSELEALKPGEGETSFSLLGVNSLSVGDDRDESLPPRLMGRLVKAGSYIRDVVRRGFQDVINQMISKERELPISNVSKDPALERWGESLQAASQHVVTGLLEFIKQQAVNAPNGDVQLAAAAASAVVSNVGSAVAGVFESFASNNSYLASGSSGMATSTKCARRVMQVHMQCLRLLKEALGEKQNRALESALACEATSVVANAIGHTSGRAPRPQFQLSPETPDPYSALGDLGASTNGLTLVRSNTAAAAVSALLVCLVLEGIIGLEKLISLLKIKEGLENIHLLKSSSLNPNGMSRVLSTGNVMKSESMAEVNLFWFRVLIGDCRSVAGGLVAEVLGESSMLALLQMQRLLPLPTVLSPAYALFSVSLRSPHSSFMIGSNRDDTSFQQLACTAVGDLLVHDPFREVCLQDTRALYSLLTRDNGDFEYASLLDSKGADLHKKLSSMVPSRPRLFLHAVLDRKLPIVSAEESYVQSRGTVKSHSSLVEELVQVLDGMHPATFHWQWVELRLLLNEQVFMEKLEAQNVSVAAEAVQAARSAIEDAQSLSESEKNFTEIILTRLLVRPDAAALFSETLSLLGRALEDYLILQVQWILENSDMLLGRKSLRQQLEEMAHRKKFKIGSGRIKVWEWLPPQVEESNSTHNNIRKPEVASPEEGEVAEEDVDCGKQLSDGVSGSHSCRLSLKKHFAIEKALADLVLPCLARSSVETRSRFASRLVKQMSDLEQQVTLLSRSSGRFFMAASEVGVNKRLGSRKGLKTGLESAGSPGIGRRMTSATDFSPPSAAALQTSLWLRLRFLLPLLPLIYLDREQMGRNMRSVLAPVLLRLLGTRVIQESVEAFYPIEHDSIAAGGRDLEWNAEAAATAAAVAAGEDLFDRILSVLHALLSSTWAVWLKQKPSYKGSSKPPREVPPLDREIVNCMQVDLDRMQLPSMVRVQLQAAMPSLAPSPFPTISAGPPQVPAAALLVLQMSGLNKNNSSTVGSVIASYKVPLRLENSTGKVKPTPPQELDTEIDPWTSLEDITSSGSTGAGSGVVSNESGSNKACAWLKGAVRVRRTDLTYVGSVDDDS